MPSKLTLESYIHSVLRTYQPQSVPETTRAVLDRVGHDPAFAPLISSCAFLGLYHSYKPKRGAFDWRKTVNVLLEGLKNEPRVALFLGGGYLSAKLNFFLNCEEEIIREKIGGKRRNAPRPSDISSASVDVGAQHFTDPAFIQSYLALLSDLFEIIGGEYGYAEHLSISHGTDFDRVRSDFFNPWFITWANFFGPGLVSRLGRDRLLSAPAYAVHELPGGSILLTVAASPLEQLQPEVQDRIARVKAHLGIRSPSEQASPEELAAFEARAQARQAEMKQRIEAAFRRAREETAAEMHRQAEGCVQGVHRFWGETLDFSPESLQVVDRLIATGFNAQEDNETIQTAVQAFGAYVGEVVRRHLGGVWHDEEMKGQPVLLQVGRGQQRLKPFEAVRRRFEERQGRGFTLAQWFEAVCQGTVG